MRIAIIVSQWNELVTKALLQGAQETLNEQMVEVFQVPGAWEIPVLASRLISTNNFQGIVALGCIMEGETMHATLLAKDVSSALMNLQVSTQIPIGWGIITAQNAEQALDRAGMKLGNKGREAAGSVMEMVRLLNDIEVDDEFELPTFGEHDFNSLIEDEEYDPFKEE
ncbi:MAG: 6,7-dimethyl-8-ribityllumazine synthase [Chthonomonas sp.]|nr:6,7-dimethyl-8-ribityllumazine synthase [Chthonomonas sp.]